MTEAIQTMDLVVEMQQDLTHRDIINSSHFFYNVLKTPYGTLIVNWQIDTSIRHILEQVEAELNHSMAINRICL